MSSKVQHRLTNRFTRGAAVAVALAMSGSFLATAQSSATAAPVPGAASATSAAGLLDVTVLAADLGPLGTVDAASVDVATATGSLQAGSPRVSARAANLGAELVGQGVPPVLTGAAQAAPPTNAAPTTVDGPAIPAAPLLSTGISRSTAHAQLDDAQCLPTTTPLSSSSTTTVDATVLDLPTVGALVRAPGEVRTQQDVRLAPATGPGDARTVVSRATSDLAVLDLFGSVTVGVSQAPTLTAFASGQAGGAQVTYTQPVVTITAPGAPGSPFTLDAADEVATFALPEDPLLTVELSLGAVTSTAAADGTSASGQAALLHLRLTTTPAAPLTGVDVADVDVVPLSVAAGAPAGGIQCGDSSSGLGSLGAPDITSPAAGAVVGDTTPTISGTGSPGATVTVTEGGTVICTAAVRQDGTWSCEPGTPLTAGPHTLTATQSQGGQTSPADAVTFTVVSDPDDPDGDGLPTAQETSLGTGPLDPDTDDDGLTDGEEVRGVEIRESFEACGRKARRSIVVTTNPLAKDTDKDGLRDGTEVKGYEIKQRIKTRTGSFVIGRTRSNPTRTDTDRDGLKDKAEATGTANKKWGKAKTDPTACDTDRGGVRDGAEVRAEANPADWRSGPRHPGVRNGRSLG